MNHVAFAVPPERIEEYRERLWPPTSTAPRWPITTTASGASPTKSIPVFVRSIYFQDPDGILLEFACWTRPLTPADVRHAPPRASDLRPVECAAGDRARRPPCRRIRRAAASARGPIRCGTSPTTSTSWLRMVPWPGTCRIGLYPNLGVTWWTTMIVGADRPLVASVAYDLPVAWGIRTGASSPTATSSTASVSTSRCRLMTLRCTCPGRGAR